MITKTANAFYANIYMAGPIEEAKLVCAEFCFSEGLCVTVTSTDFIYTGGRESGFVVGLVNYPRFTASEQLIFERAEELAIHLINRLSQHSALIQTPYTAVWKSRRKEQPSNE